MLNNKDQEQESGKEEKGLKHFVPNPGNLYVVKYGNPAVHSSFQTRDAGV